MLLMAEAKKLKIITDNAHTALEQSQKSSTIWFRMASMMTDLEAVLKKYESVNEMCKAEYTFCSAKVLETKHGVLGSRTNRTDHGLAKLLYG